MERPAREVYEIVVEEAEPRRGAARWWRRRARWRSPGARIISVRELRSGDEVFRHIELDDDDEDSLLGPLGQGLETMTAAEFARRWGAR